MAYKKVADIVATTGTYKDRDTGEEKKRRQNCGVMLKDLETGYLTIKLEVIPIGEFSGFFNVFPVDKDKQQGTQRDRQDQQQVNQMQNIPDDPDRGDDIPF